MASSLKWTDKSRQHWSFLEESKPHRDAWECPGGSENMFRCTWTSLECGVMEFLQHILRECNPVESSLFRTRFFERRTWNVPNVETNTGFQLVTRGRVVLRSDH